MDFLIAEGRATNPRPETKTDAFMTYIVQKCRISAIAYSELPCTYARTPLPTPLPDRYQVVILDDIGYVQQNREEMEVLFTLLAERY